MTNEQITECMAECHRAVVSANRMEIVSLRFLANELLDYREALAIVDAKGYNVTGRTLAKLMELLPEKAKEAEPCRRLLKGIRARQDHGPVEGI